MPRNMAAAAALMTALAADATAQELPLKWGFYVNEGTACSQASNATLLLLGRTMINTSRNSCEIQAINTDAPKSFILNLRCEEMGSAKADARTVRLKALDQTLFTIETQEGATSVHSHCLQAYLPEPWRSNDIADLVK